MTQQKNEQTFGQSPNYEAGTTVSSPKGNEPDFLPALVKAEAAVNITELNPQPATAEQGEALTSTEKVVHALGVMAEFAYAAGLVGVGWGAAVAYSGAYHDGIIISWSSTAAAGFVSEFRKLRDWKSNKQKTPKQLPASTQST